MTRTGGRDTIFRLKIQPRAAVRQKRPERDGLLFADKLL